MGDVNGVETELHGPKIAIANNHKGVTGFGVVGNPGFVSRTLEKLQEILGNNANLKDIAGLAEPGTTATSPDNPAKQ